MIDLTIPGWGNVHLDNLVMDFNGTLATDGKLIEGVSQRLEALHKRGLNLFVITADTNGTVKSECAGLPVQVMGYDNSTVAQDKARLVQQLGPKNTACIGNGRNDLAMFEASELSAVVIGTEGAYVKSIQQADVLFSNILDALDFFLKDHRMKATLRG